MLLVEEYGLKLVFNSNSHLLMLIEIYNFNKVLFSRNDNVLNLDYRHPEFQRIYNKIFGPTYPGELDDSSYFLNYDGVCFKFDLKNYTRSQKLLQYINENSHSIFCKSVYIFQGSSLKEYIKNDHGDQVSFLKRVVNARINLLLKTVNFGFKDPKLKVYPAVIGRTTMHSTITHLGPPEGVFVKGTDKYHNYYSIGCDLCFDISKTDGSSPILKKINIHNNLINSLEFMKYDKLVWDLVVGTHTVKGYATYDVIVPLFKTAPKPIFLNRNEYDLVNSLNNKFEKINLSQQQNFELIDYEDDFDEGSDLTYNEEIGAEIKHESSSETLSKNNLSTSLTIDRSKDWGLTNLYSYSNILFEVLLDTNEVSMVSIF